MPISIFTRSPEYRFVGGYPQNLFLTLNFDRRVLGAYSFERILIQVYAQSPPRQSTMHGKS